ncbi:MAG: hypothetical protein IT201_03250 [Thermoleophilia bacterium]|nr:hypothetical protein [Thermoleophilia bacterium]
MSTSPDPWAWESAEQFWRLCRTPPRSFRFCWFPGDLRPLDPETGDAQTYRQWLDELERDHPEPGRVLRLVDTARTPDEIEAARIAVEDYALAHIGDNYAYVAGRNLSYRLFPFPRASGGFREGDRVRLKRSVYEVPSGSTGVVVAAPDDIWGGAYIVVMDDQSVVAWAGGIVVVEADEMELLSPRREP